MTLPATVVLPDAELVSRILTEMELNHTTDADGDLGAPWDDFRVYFMFRGEDAQRMFAVRAFYDRPHAAGELPWLLEAVDEWNRASLWPKVYTHKHTDGGVRLIGEVQMLIGQGVSYAHFVTSMATWIAACVEFDSWLVQRRDDARGEPEGD